MKKLLLGGSLVLALVVYIFTGYVAAQKVQDNFTVAKDEILNKDVFAAGEVISIEGTVNGDVYAAGERLQISGTINGDVYGAASVIEISGQVSDDIHVAGQTVNLNNAKIGDSAHMAGETINSTEATSIGGSMLFASSTLNANSSIGRAVRGAGSSSFFNNRVGQDMRLYTGSLTFGTKANVQGNVKYYSDNDAKVQNGATLAGGIEKVQPQQSTNPAKKFAAFSKGVLIWSYLSALVMGCLMVALIKRPLASVTNTLSQNPGAVFGWGALVFFAAVPAMILIAITVLGLPLALVLLTLFVLSLYLSKFIVSLALGNWLLGRLNKEATPNPFAAMVLGLSVIYVLKVLPLINILAVIIVTFMGFGALLVATKRAVSAKPAKRPTNSKTKK